MTDDEMRDIVARELAREAVERLAHHGMTWGRFRTLEGGRQCLARAAVIVEAIHAGDPLSKRRPAGARGQRTICEALRELGRILEDSEQGREIVAECLDYAQRMNAKLRDYAGK